MLGAVLLAASVWAGGPTVGALSAATMARVAEQRGPSPFVSASPPCPEPAEHCFEIALHVAQQDGQDVVVPEWFSAQVSEANRLFEPIGVGFRVGSVTPVDERFADVVTREDRDLLGRTEHSLGVIHVFVVRSLADVDVAGEVIRGVHWRDRVDVSRRWIILSSIASSLVLAHETGHFFGLPHSSYRTSIMNKSPHVNPPWPLRTFVEQEQAIMARRRDAMLADGTLRAPERRK